VTIGSISSSLRLFNIIDAFFLSLFLLFNLVVMFM
jgi:hypothetical protein